MKKFITALSIFFLLSMTASAAVRTSLKGSKGDVLVAEFYLLTSDSLTVDYVLNDYKDLLERAVNNKKCKSIYIFTADNSLYKIIKKDTLDVSKELNRFETNFDNITYTASVSIPNGTRREFVSGPKYVSKTYHNGRLDSVYESDWSGGSFSTETSTYRSGYDTYETKTYYQPAQYKTVTDYKIVKTTYTGLDVFANVFYRCWWKETRTSISG